MRRVLACAAASAVLLAGCTAQGGVVVTLDEYSIDVKPRSEQAGELTLTARNIGAIAHQLVVLRTTRPFDKLPVDRNGVVPLDVKGIEQLGEIPIVADGDSEPLSLDLGPGEYALICNIASHYTNGMRASFRVR